MIKNIIIILSIVVVVVFTTFIKKDTQELPNITLSKDATILAFGDSLTNGFGAPFDSSYPSFLQRKTGIKVINAGVNGELSSEGLQRLPRFLKDKPSLVILCHGGNDILQNLSKTKLKENLSRMVQLIKNSGSKVLLVAVPDFNMINFKNTSIYEEVANESEIMFEDEALRYIELHRALKSDYVHPNAKGYEYMADSFIKVLQSNKIIP